MGSKFIPVTALTASSIEETIVSTFSEFSPLQNMEQSLIVLLSKGWYTEIANSVYPAHVLSVPSIKAYSFDMKCVPLLFMSEAILAFNFDEVRT